VMGLTPERAKQIMFTSPYADTNLSVFGPKSANVKSAADIGSLKVAAAKGTTQEMALTAMAPKANIMRTEDDATAAAAYLSGQAELFATNNLIIPDLQKRNPSKEFEIKFVIRRSPAHMGVRMGELTLVRWLDSFIFFNTMNGELDRLHQKWLGMPMQPMPSL
jgi:polar amino acid transport system substrate-binding protein